MSERLQDDWWNFLILHFQKTLYIFFILLLLVTYFQLFFFMNFLHNLWDVLVKNNEYLKLRFFQQNIEIGLYLTHLQLFWVIWIKYKSYFLISFLVFTRNRQLDEISKTVRFALENASRYKNLLSQFTMERPRITFKARK